MRNIPNLIVSAPMDEIELRNLMFTAQLSDKGPFSIRYPRGNGFSLDWKRDFEEIPIGKGRLIRDGEDLAVLSIGHPGNFVVEASKLLQYEGISIAHYDMRFVSPIDQIILDEVADKFKNVITIEDGIIEGGFGSAVIEYYSSVGKNIIVKRLGISNRFVEHGSQSQLYRECGFDVEGICNAVREMVTKV